MNIVWAPGIVPLNNAEFEACINSEEEINVDVLDDSDAFDFSDIFIIVHDDD